MLRVKHFGVTELPAECVGDAIYFVKNESGLKMFVTDNEGVPFALTIPDELDIQSLPAAEALEQADQILISRMELGIQKFYKLDKDLINNYKALPVFLREADAFASLGYSKPFLYDTYNLDGVPSTYNSQIALTRKQP